jgi:hypothetical protein
MQACCPAAPLNKPVVNADQTVIILWDAAAKTQHFIRQASFKSDADDFGFLVPSPSQPELDESGNEAFPYFLKLTEPEVQKVTQSGGGCSCAIGCASGSSAAKVAAKASPEEVRVLQEKQVAGFKTTVLEADTTAALAAWLKEHGYAFSREVEAWAKPYVGAGWKITAFKVAKDDKGRSVSTAALRISFKTDRPLFPYREPDYKNAATALGASSRMLRIYFLGEARYEGELTKDVSWTGKVAFANKLTPENRSKALELLKLPATTGPSELWLTEFEDNWPYKVAPADVYFARDLDQSTVKRPAHIEYVSRATPADAAPIMVAMLLLVPPIVRRSRRRTQTPLAS